MKSDQLLFGRSCIHYIQYGYGPGLIFCFHGYGENAVSFAIFEEILGDRFTLIAIDFPFHGKTDWQEGTFIRAC
jgi:pimeloyl-ACP methyl ester carboxylesterase